MAGYGKDTEQQEFLRTDLKLAQLIWRAFCQFPQKSCWCFDCHCVESVNQFEKNLHFKNIDFPVLQVSNPVLDI